MKVSISRVAEYDLKQVSSALIRSLDLIGFKLPRNSIVLIKPNCLAQNRPDQHSVTHFAIIDALCSLFAANGSRILIGESSAFFQSGLTRKAFEITGMSRVAEKYGARLVPFEEQKLVKVDISDYFENRPNFPIRHVYIPQVVFEADLLVNACKLKSHGSGFRLSGAIKNLYGLLPGGFKQKIHLLLKDDCDACDLMVALHKIAQPGLSVMDAIYGLDGGPSAAGKPVPVGAILASENAAALDSVACGMIGYEPSEVPLLVSAKAQGLICDADNVVSCGDPAPSVSFKRLARGPFPGPRKKDGIFITDTFVTPVIREKKCSGCGKCIEFCPAGAISRENGKRYVIDYSKCIYCYYCFVPCPENAIGYRSTFKNKLIRFSQKLAGL
jgi:uncharacterized protein (DUF362 family)/ferredoxin